MCKQEAASPSRGCQGRSGWPRPYTVVLEGRGNSWGCGRGLYAERPVALLRVDAGGGSWWWERGVETKIRGREFELFERFCRAHLGPKPDGRHVVVAISYGAGRTYAFLPEPASGRGAPLLVAAAYEPEDSFEFVEGESDLRVLLPAHCCVDCVAGARRMRVRGLPGEAFVPKWKLEDHRQAVLRVLDYVRAGDVYQVNLAYPWRSGVPVCAWAIFRVLQESNPVPYGAYFHCGSFELVTNSPECFLARRGTTLCTRPIKGTRPRGGDRAEDERLLHELQQDPKEQAELLMIVDLERNDLGRVCETGSVQVTRHAAVRTFSRWHHLESEICGRLRPNLGWQAILGAMFPGGSVTGAPKKRAMEIIDELESEPRGFYTGCLGWLRSQQEADFALTIRTAVIDKNGLEYWTGGGIVADSRPEFEYWETWVKAQALWDVLSAL